MADMDTPGTPGSAHSLDDGYRVASLLQSKLHGGGGGGPTNPQRNHTVRMMHHGDAYAGSEDGDRRSSHRGGSRKQASSVGDTATNASQSTSSSTAMIQTQFTSFLQIFRVSQHGIAMNLFHGLLIFVFLVQSMSVPIDPAPNSELVTMLTTRIATALRTWGTSFIPLDIFYFIVPALLALQLMCIAVLFLSSVMFNRGNATMARHLKNAGAVLATIDFMLFFPGVYSATSFLNCHYVEDALHWELATNGVKLQCWNFDGSLTGLMAIMSLVAIVLQVALSCFFIIATLTSHPDSPNVFSTEDPTQLLAEVVANGIQVALVPLLPATNDPTVSWIRHIIYLVMLAFILLLFRRTMPFYRPLSSAFYTGAVVARIAITVSILIGEVVALSMPGTENAYIVIGSVGGAVVLSGFVGFVVGALTSLLWQGIAIYRATKWFTALANNRDAAAHSHDHTTKDGQTQKPVRAISYMQLEAAAKSLLGDTFVTRSKDEKINMLEQLFMASNSHEMNSTRMLLLESQFYMSVNLNPMYALSMMHKSPSSRPSLLMRLMHLRAMGDMESLFKDTLADQQTSKILRNLRQKQVSFQVYMKEFFRVMMEEEGPQSIPKLDALATHLYSLTTNSNKVWQTLLLQNSKNPNVLRSFASYIAAVDNDQDRAEAIIQEAEDLEESISRKLNRASKAAKGHGGGRLGGESLISAAGMQRANKNRVHPYSADDSSPSIFANGIGTMQVNNAAASRKSMDVADDQTFSIGGEDENYMELDELDQEDAGHRNAYKRAITADKKRWKMIVSLLVVLTTTVCGFIAMFSVSYWAINTVTPHSIFFDTCSLSVTPMNLLRSIRFVQLSNKHELINSVYADHTKQGEMVHNVWGSIRTSINRFSTFLAVQSGTISTDSMWTSPDTAINYPILSPDVNSSIPFDRRLYLATNSTALMSLVGLFNQHANPVLLRAQENLIDNSTDNDLSDMFGPLLSSNEYSIMSNNNFMFLYTNALSLATVLINACHGELNSFTRSSQLTMPVVFSVVGAGAFILVVANIVFFIMVYLVIKERYKTFQMLQQVLSKETLASAHSTLDSKLRVYGDRSEMRDASSRRRKKSRLPLLLGALYVLIILVQIAFLLCAILFYNSSMVNEQEKAAINYRTAVVKRTVASSGLLAQEYFFNQEPHMLNLLFEGFTLDRLREGIESEMKIRRDERFRLFFGDSTTKGVFSNGLPLIQQVLNQGTCAPGSNVSLLATENIEESLKVYSTECLPPLSLVAEAYSSHVHSSLEGYKSIQLDADRPPLLKQAVTHIYNTGSQIVALQDFIARIYETNSTQKTSYLTGLSIAFASCVSLVAVFSLLLLLLMRQVLARNMALKRVLLWIANEDIENSTELRDYVLYDNVTITNNKSLNRARDLKSLSIIQAATDGIILLTEKLSVMELNRAASELLLHSESESIGRPFASFLAGKDDAKELNKIGSHLLHSKKNTLSKQNVNGKSDQFDTAAESDNRQIMAASSTTLDTITPGGGGAGGGGGGGGGGSAGRPRQMLERTASQYHNNSITVEMDMRRKDGRTIPVRLSFSAGLFQGRVIICAFMRDITLERKAAELLAYEKQKSEQLLLNVLPPYIATRLKNGETNISEQFEDVTCLFSDICGFTSMSSGITPHELVTILNGIVTVFDNLTTHHGVEKIKTIGDAFFAVGGLPSSQPLDPVVAERDHPERVVRLAIDMIRSLRSFNATRRPAGLPIIDIRIGINTGRITGGVIGVIKYVFDCFGDCVNVASRMESTGLPGHIQVSRATYQRVFDMFPWKERQNVDIKGKGTLTTYIISVDDEPITPNVQQSSPKPPRASINLTVDTSVNRKQSNAIPFETNAVDDVSLVTGPAITIDPITSDVSPLPYSPEPIVDRHLTANENRRATGSGATTGNGNGNGNGNHNNNNNGIVNHGRAAPMELADEEFHSMMLLDDDQTESPS